MEVTVLEEKKKRVVVELKGANHGLCHALKNELWNDGTVTVASYVVEHPMTSVPKLVVETNSEGNPHDALKKAIERLKKQIEQFKTELKKVKA